MHRPLIERWLAGDNETRPLRLTKIHTLLVRNHALRASWRFAHEELEWREKPSTVRVDDAAPGQEAQVDFGKMGPSWTRRPARSACSGRCDHARLQPVPVRVADAPTFRQSTEVVCEGLDRAWMFFGGIIRTLIPDNTKAMILDPDAIAPTLVSAFLDYAPGRGIFVDPARVRSPKDKLRVENQGQGSPGPPRPGRAGAVLGAEPFLRRHAPVRADRKLVKNYFGTELIKVHERQQPGGRSTDPKDYPAGKAVYALRDVDTLRAKAKEKGIHIGAYADRLLGGPLPWTKMRQGYALLALCEKYGNGRVEAMCQSALAFDVVNVAEVSAMLKSAAKTPRPSSGKVVQFPLPRFTRPAEHFETNPAAVKSTGATGEKETV